MRALLFSLASCMLAASAVSALPPGTLSMDLTRAVNQSAYAVEMSIGTPPQKMSVIIDTGSRFMGLAGTKSNWCQLPSKPCAQYGSYDNTTSSTARFINDDFNNALINHGYGDYITDIVRVGGHTYPRIEFGMILDYAASFPAPDTITGLVGLAPFCYTNGNCSQSPATTLQQRLIRRGFIKRNVASVYLGKDTATARGQLLFGAIDRANQLTTPVTFPVISPADNRANSSPNYARFSSISLVQASKTEDGGAMTSHFNISKKSYGILDTGSPQWYLPTPAWKYVKNYFHLPNDSDSNGNRAVDCKFRQAQPDGASLYVGFANDKLKIGVPMERLVTQLGPAKCVTAVNDCGSTGEGCGFGDPFLRSTYISFDFDALTVTMSNVRYTSKSDIEAA